MKCDCEDCFHCPHADCILDEGEDIVTIQKKKKKSEYDKQYYQKNRKRILDRVKKRQVEKKQKDDLYSCSQ